MRTRQHNKSDADSVQYTEIRDRLAKIKFDSICEDNPGPGYYNFTTSASTSRYGSTKTSLSLAKRFHRVQNNDTQNSVELSSNRTRRLDVSSFLKTSLDETALKKFSTEQTLPTSSEFFLTENKSNLKLSKLNGSFSKAERQFNASPSRLVTEPAMYNVNVSSTAVQYSFGRKLKPLLERGSDSPGPGNYKPENCKTTSDHPNSARPVFMKSDRDFVKSLPSVKNGLTGGKYYFYSHYSSFKPSRDKGASLGLGSKSVSMNKLQLSVPGPGAYDVIKRPWYSQTLRDIEGKYFPTFGQSTVVRRDPEVLPGPGEYGVKVINTSRAAKIGTSKRPGFFNGKKDVEAVFSQEKMKRIRRMQQKEADLLMKKAAVSSTVRSPVSFKQRKLIFDEIAEQNSTPGPIYDIGKYNQTSQSPYGAKIGNSNRTYLVKELEERKNMPGPASYEPGKEEGNKHYTESSFGGAKRPDIFLKKDAYLIPGVASYNTKDIEKAKRGGVIARARKGLNDAKTEERWEQSKKQEKPESFYNFIENLEKELKHYLKAQETDI